MIEFPRSIKDGDIELVKPAPTAENAKKLFGMIDSNRAYISEWLVWVENVKTPNDQLLFLQAMDNKENGDYIIKLCDELVGYAGFYKTDEKNLTAEMAYYLNQEYVGRGIMTRAVKMLERVAFEDIGLNRIEMKIEPENTKSVAIPKRSGYHLDGILRATKLRAGKFRDGMVYSKLKSEWEAENKNEKWSR